MFAPLLMTVARRYASRGYGAEDILQESFIKIFKNLESFNGNESAFKAWSRKIVVNTALNILRREHNKFEEITERHSGISNNDSASKNIDAEYLIKEIQELPVQYRTVFNLYAVEGYTHKEISKLLQIKEASSRSNLSRARALLASSIKNKKYDQSWEKIS